MNFFDKLQEAVYDIIGYLVPGIIAAVLVLPSFLLYVQKGTLAFPVEAVLTYGGLAHISWLKEIDLASTIGLAVIFTAYLLGHVIKYLAEMLFKQIFKAESKLFLKKGENTLNDVSTEAEEIFKNRFEKSDIGTYDDSKKEKVLTSYGRVQIRMHEIPSLVQKYISKYNFYRSLAFICLILLFNIIITFWLKSGLAWKGLLILAIVAYLGICIKLNRGKDKTDKKDETNTKLKAFTESCLKVFRILCGFSGILRCVFYSQILYCFFTQSLFIYLTLYGITLLFYQAFIYEFKRHYRLSVKEALFGVLYEKDGKEAG